MNEKEMFGVRLNNELSNWVKEEANKNSCSVSEIITNAIALARKINDTPEKFQYSELLNIQGSKAALMNYRLMELLTNELVENSKQVIDKAFEISKKDIADYKI